MITAIIPTYNEEKTIKETIIRAKKHCDEILVVGAKKSTDQTIEIAKSLGVRTLIDNGMGKGAAMRQGIDAAKGDIIVFIDSDGSHICEDMPLLTEPISNGAADMVIASRMLGGSEELHGTVFQFIRLCLSAMITLIINYRFNIRITDSQNGFRAIKKDVAKKLDLKANIFDIETEITMKCAKKRYRIFEVPSRELKRVCGKSGVNILKMGPTYFWRVILNLF